MKLFVLLFIYEYLVAHSTAIQSCDDMKLELVQVLLRHGSRTPIQLELDAYNYIDISAYEPWGLGELTDIGRQREYEFGKFLRKRYANYLRSTYRPEDVYAYASDTSRTKISLSLVLAGLYPPTNRAEWNEYPNWIPIPYSSVPTKLDILLRANENSKVLKLAKEVANSDEYKSKIAEYSDFFDFVANNTGSNSSVMNSVLAFGVLMSHEYMNLSLPDWYTPEVRQKFIELMELTWDVYTIEMKRLATGPLIKTFIENMNLHGTIHNPRKIYVYAGHDTIVALFIRSHNIQEFRYPFYGSGLIFEKLRGSEGQVYTRLFAWDGLGQLTPLKINNREVCCSINDYLEIVKSVIPSETEIDDMIGSLNSTEIKKLLMDNSVNPF